MQEDHRKTYLGSDEHYDQITLEIIDEIKATTPTCQRILKVLEQHSQIGDRKQLQQIFLDDIDQLTKLIQICLEPEKLHIRTRSWPYLAKSLLTKNPPELLLSLLKPDCHNGSILFQFLKDNPNQTARGYFSELLHRIEYDSQDKVSDRITQLFNYLMEDVQTLNLCLMKSYYPEVFSFLFSLVVYATEDNFEFAEKVCKILLGKVSLSEHVEEFAENCLLIFQEVYRCYEKLISKQFLDPQEQQYIKKFSTRVHSLCSSVIDCTYAQITIKLCLDYCKKNEYVCELLLRGLTQIVRIYKILPELCKSIDEQWKQNNLESSMVVILKNMKHLAEILQQSQMQIIQFSSGEQVHTIGLVKYHTLELLEVVLTLEPSLVKAHYDMNKGRVLQYLQKYMTTNPWNNIVHGFVQKIVINLINSFDRYSELSEDYTGPNGFLGFLIQNFRNQNYMFLNSGNLSNYGYLHYLYNIAKAVCIKLKQSQILSTIMEKFEDWEQFLVNDMQKYEKMLDFDLGGEPLKLVNERKLNSHESIRTIVVDLNKKEVNQSGDGGDVINDRFVQVEFRVETVQTRESHSHPRRNTFSATPVNYRIGEKVKSQSPELKKYSSEVSQNEYTHQLDNSTKNAIKKQELMKYRIVLDEQMQKKLQSPHHQKSITSILEKNKTLVASSFKRTISEQRQRQKEELPASKHKLV